MSKIAQSVQSNLPPDFKLHHTLRGHKDVITQVAWSPDGKMLASASIDQTVRIWDAETGELHQTIQGESPAFGLAWSPDGQRIATAFGDDTEVRLWEAMTGTPVEKLREQPQHEIRIIGPPTQIPGEQEEPTKYYKLYSVAWSPLEQILVTGHASNKFRLWDSETGGHFARDRLPDNFESMGTIGFGAVSITGDVYVGRDIGDMLIHNVFYHRISQQKPRPFYDLEERNFINCFTWSPDGQTFAFASGSTKLRIEDAKIEDRNDVLEHDSLVLGVSWSPDGRILASSCLDGTVQLWDFETKQQLRIVEGHADAVTSISFFPDGRFLASKSLDDTVRIWRCDTWETILILHEPASRIWPSNLVFHPTGPMLASLVEGDTVVRIWKFDVETLLNVAPVDSSVHYTNAKVVLVGDTGVGKSGLARALTDQPFIPTESTHGRHVWTFDKRGSVESGQAETRETMLWDLAGQPGYRIIHQLHLNEVAVALIVMDARSETDPFSGVRHWDRALRQAQRIQGAAAPPLKKFLVAARADRGGVGVSHNRINALIQSVGFESFVETSAKEGWGIAELAQTIREAIDWNTLPKVSSTRLFKHIKDFLIAEKEAGRLLAPIDDLFRAFLKSDSAPNESEELREQFEICIGRVESRGLIRRLSFGNLVLLQPELLDAYASAIVNAAKDEPDGLGSLSEETARQGRFRISVDERLEDNGLEELLLIATVEDLLFHEIALREPADDGPHLVFPSQLTRERPDLPDPAGKSVIFQFEGPVLNIYATLAVRLSHSGLFKKKEMWKNAVTYSARSGGVCGMFLREPEEGRGELTVFIEQAPSKETQLNFEEYIHLHLQRRALPNRVYRRRIIVCGGCGFVVPEQLIYLISERSRSEFDCPVCQTRISLLEPEEKLDLEATQSALSEMDSLANIQREQNIAESTIQGKIAINDFDVFLCHNSEDKPAVKRIGEDLKELGVLPWLDEWELPPGQPWQKNLEQQIKQIKSAAVFVGARGIGPWQDAELAAFLRQFVKRECPVIPVILPDCEEKPELPLFLEGMMWVDFRKKDPDPMRQLIWGITGERDRPMA